MNLDPAPRLNKTPFILTAAGCLTAVVLIALFAPNKFAPLPFLSAVGFLLISIIVVMIPIIIDYGADSAEYVQAERGRVADQVQRLHAAGESLARAAAQIKAVEESVHKTAHAAENLPYRMQEKLAEFNEALATKDNEEREALERELDELRAANADNLKAVADKIAKAAAEWSGLESASRKQLAGMQDATTRLNSELQATLAQLDSRISALGKAAASAPVAAVYDRRAEPATPEDVGHRPPLQPEPAATLTPPEEPKPEPAPAALLPTPAAIIESVTLSDAPVAPVGETKPKKPRAPRKPKPEETLAAMSAESAPAETSSAIPEPAATSSEEAAEPSLVEASVSSDGATRLLVTAYIGIGNKLFIRGDGPGLSWDKGVPMQFVSIGKWGWASNDVTAPIACKLYKNDETAALSGEIFVEPGKHIELTALF
jgi:biopolymer transport protein ExbB/TolQ